MESVPSGSTGRASAIGQTSYELGLVFGIAVTGSLAAASYRASVFAAAPDSLPPAQAAEIADSIGAGLAEAQSIPGSLGETTINAVHDALVSGANTAVFISAGLTVLLGVTACFVLKRAN